MTGGHPDDQLGALLAEELRTLVGPCDVVDLSRLKGGYSREMWSFDLVSEGGRRQRELIVCMDRAGGVVGQGSQALTRVEEGRLLGSLHAVGVPVPDVMTYGDSGSRLGRPFLVMERLPGTTAIGPLHRDPRYAAARHVLGLQLAERLACIHGCPAVVGALGAAPDPAAVFGRQLGQWSAELSATPQACTPVFARAVRWLEHHPAPPPAAVAIVHGDYRTGNILHVCDRVRGPRFTAVLDWEMAHLGDPLEDVAWAALVCWRIGTNRVGGVVELDEWPDVYARVSGRPADRAAVRIWSVLASVKMACLLHRARHSLEEGSERALLDRLFEDLEGELDSTLAQPVW